MCIFPLDTKTHINPSENSPYRVKCHNIMMIYSMSNLCRPYTCCLCSEDVDIAFQMWLTNVSQVSHIIYRYFTLVYVPFEITYTSSAANEPFQLWTGFHVIGSKQVISRRFHPCTEDYLCSHYHCPQSEFHNCITKINY